MEIRDKKGFTLIEMIISIMIIVMITAIFIANYRDTNKRTDLVMAAQKLVADLHQAQNNTLGLIKYNTDVPAGGWGVHFSTNTPNSYVIFADLDVPETFGYLDYDGDEGNVNYGARVTELSDNIEINALRIGGVLKTTVNVTFLPPDPITNIYDGTDTFNNLEIELKETRNSSIKTISVNFLGLVEVID